MSSIKAPGRIKKFDGSEAPGKLKNERRSRKGVSCGGRHVSVTGIVSIKFVFLLSIGKLKSVKLKPGLRGSNKTFAKNLVTSDSYDSFKVPQIWVATWARGRIYQLLGKYKHADTKVFSPR